MVQEMNVLRCYSCHMFQVHIVKKTNKWQCKICYERQSIQHVYYQGSGEYCRRRVQHLNFLKHTKYRQESEESEKIKVIETKYNSAGMIERPLTANSRWTKYMATEKENHQTGSNDVKSRGPLSYCNRISSHNTNIYQDNRTTDKNYLDEKLVAGEKIENSVPLEINFSQNSPATRATYNDDASVHITSSSHSSNMLYRNNNYRKDEEDDDPLLEKSHLPYITRANVFHEYITHRSRIKFADAKNHHPSFSRNYSCNFTEKKQSTITISKQAKRKFDSETVSPEFLSVSFGFESADTPLDPSKLTDESSCRKQSLRDIVRLNRSNAGKTSLNVTNSKIVAKQLSQKSDVKKRTIFETNCYDFDEISDFW